MSIWLPVFPRLGTAQMLPFDAGGELRSPLGGQTIQVERLGDRHVLRLNLPVMSNAGCGGVWASRLDQGRKVGVLMYLPPHVQRMGSLAAPGAPVVNGAGAAGKVLPIRGLSGGYPFAEGQFLSVIQAGKRYLYKVAADTVASGGGTVNLPITTMIRAPLSDGATVEITAPVIEGFIPRDYPGPVWSRRGRGPFDPVVITES